MHDHVHVDEIDALAWIAASAFALMLLTALLIGPTQTQRVARDLNPPAAPSLPLVPPEMIADPRA
jgi:hypothetical protein